ncbi:hypothetical protein NX059_005825 [Plenodomus lindquistii]|nr:hypothetical protein NX059_005825 [Plenodomus lindquistii]
MRFTLPALVLALAASVSAMCQINGQGAHTVGDPRCCWGTADGANACFRQKGSEGCLTGAETKNFCSAPGTPAKCVSSFPPAWQ